MPQQGYSESERAGQDASERDHPKSDRSKSAASKKNGSKSTNGDWPRLCIPEIKYKFDKKNRLRHVRPRIEYVFPDGQRYYEPWTEDKVDCAEVEMDPEIGGIPKASIFKVSISKASIFKASISKASIFKVSISKVSILKVRLFKFKLFRTISI